MVPTTSSSCSRRSMEDVWTDISLSYLSHNSCNTTTTAADDPAAAAFRGIIFQDFLACTSTISSNIEPKQPAAASTVLSLNSGTRSDLEQRLLETTRTTITDPRPLKPNPKLNPLVLVLLLLGLIVWIITLQSSLLATRKGLYMIMIKITMIITTPPTAAGISA
ncbi:hypothetical protein C1H46_006878 [Malus baccata]|uniref:Uncharacterized protein n=1 Tax=Malus baccata TaxID=106549 RepID=A0A540N927_MALBA|nr:hypothetical protein C1H46_006878 [Malus baccata]